MPRKHDAHKDELEGVARRLRDERPQASPLDLDRIKMSAMSRAQSAGKRGRLGTRRLAVASLTVGLLAAGTGGVLADEGGSNGGNGNGNAAVAQYGGNCDVNNGNGANNNSGNNGNGSGTNNFNCNENSFNTTYNTTNITYTITNNNGPVTVTAAPANNGVQGASTTKKFSGRHIKLHINVPRKSKLRRVTLRVNGKIVSVFKGKKASKNINLVNLPCTTSGTVVTITAITDSGKTVTQSHTYNLC